MRPATFLGLFFALVFAFEVTAQDAPFQPTKIVRFEIDGRESKKDYKVLFRSGEEWIESERTSTGFIIPAVLRDLDYLTFVIKFGKHKLEFHEIHRSKFTVDWVVGIDNRPFSDDIAWGVELGNVKRLHYIIFKGQPETIRVVIKEKR